VSQKRGRPFKQFYAFAVSFTVESGRTVSS
jgi:hypothetical protein